MSIFRFSRRDFLKTSAALAASATFAGASQILSSAHFQTISKPNILIFVFDAMSARHLSLYGYARQTTPNMEKFAERASVYHQHYSLGNFTTTGTASMLTGLYPWTHRAFNYRAMIDRTLANRNLFHLIGNEYTRLAFTQNLWADILLSQFETDLDIHLPCDSYSQFVHSLVQPDDLPRDRAMAYYIFQDFLNLRVDDPDPFPGSLFTASTDLSRALASDRKNISDDYPRGLPTNYDYSYENRSVLDGVGQLIQSSLTRSSPLFAYVHLWSPHGPYNARKDFIGLFQEDLKLETKPRHPLSASNFSEQSLWKYRREYDEFIADVDAEFGKLMSNLETSGILQNSYVILTSDHGELFERGEQGHASALMYAPVTHVPLLISAPGQQTRSDFHSLTSSLDLLPTLLQIVGKEIPNWIEGRLLPGFGGTEEANASRSIFPMMAKDNAAFRPIKHGTFTLIKDEYELFFFTGYSDHPDIFELYYLQEDPDELHDLFRRDITTASQMKDELLEAISTANRNYQKK
jgi:arylsulfatase A-like enzyme